ncbi:hypothetical protein GYMLUDRAFT_252489 [Collybiopsis luxurians FD-317 M1]|uniref:Uncharacterized protein n=1 Tax=Collybiopsis luxurians FD-317 M1 TaxID=944289 RepID=A0A0D0B9T0_9AGAR|nr:hypothetical protein GYMLUDRAFT_252489 [Collybiopsis luxurians FD-317 M1]
MAVVLGNFFPDTEYKVNTFFSLIAPFFNILPNILISRLMLNLCTFSNPAEMSRIMRSAEGRQYSGLQFATNGFLGNIGAPLGRESTEEEENNYGEE